MTIRTVLEKSDPRFIWLDAVDPTRDELSELVTDYGLHPLSVNDCLDPEHLPKYEVFENHTFVILRAVDALLPGDALLIAGKGHESGQIVGTDVYPFDDVEQASVAVAALDGVI